MKNIINILQTGSSLDLKAGQAVDRVGLMLGLDFPCGAALEKLDANFLAAQSAEFDGVSGATITSDAYKEAVADALAQMNGGKVEEEESSAVEEESSKAEEESSAVEDGSSVVEEESSKAE